MIMPILCLIGKQIQSNEVIWSSGGTRILSSFSGSGVMALDHYIMLSPPSQSLFTKKLHDGEG